MPQQGLDNNWLSTAHTWIGEVASRLGAAILAPISVHHVRPWSTVLRVPTSAGDWYFKAAAPVLANEIPLTNALAGWIPEATLPLLALDLARGWMLMPDGGTRLREIIRADLDVGHWEHTLPIYAQAQITLAQHLPEMLAFGTPDRRLSLLPRLYEEIIHAVPALQVDPEERLTAEELRQLQRLVPHVQELCTQLAKYPLPATLHHGDLHDGNIFVRDGKPVFFDWGDASLTHPFVSLRTVFVSVEISFNLPEGAAVEYPFRDAYLEPWTQFAPYPNLLKAFHLAQRLAPLISALSWYHGVAALEDELRREHGLAVHLLLREFLEM